MGAAHGGDAGVRSGNGWVASAVDSRPENAAGAGGLSEDCRRGDYFAGVRRLRVDLSADCRRRLRGLGSHRGDAVDDEAACGG